MTKAKFSEHITNFRKHGTFKLKDVVTWEGDQCKCCGNRRLKHVHIVTTDGQTFRIGSECWKAIEAQQWDEEKAILNETYACHICGNEQSRGGNPLLAYEKKLCYKHYCEYRDEIKEGK